MWSCRRRLCQTLQPGPLPLCFFLKDGLVERGDEHLCGSNGLAAQEGRDIENVVLDQIVSRRGSAVESMALRSFARIFRNGRCRSFFGVVGRRRLLWSFGLGRLRTVNPFGDAMAAAAQLADEFLQCIFRRLYLGRRTGVIDAG